VLVLNDTAARKQVFDEWQEGIIDRLGDFKLDLVGRCKFNPFKTRASKSPRTMTKCVKPLGH
jgi:hypothetical protein